MTRWQKGLSVAVAVALALSLSTLADCSRTAGSLDGTRWKLVGWTLSSIDPATVTITAEFAGGQISGNIGVNSYSGLYKAGPGNAFSARPEAGPLTAGSEPAMRAESAYLTLLSQANAYKNADGKLTLYDGGGEGPLIFEALGK